MATKFVSGETLPLNCDYKARPFLHPRYGGEVTKSACRSLTILTAIMSSGSKRVSIERHRRLKPQIDSPLFRSIAIGEPGPARSRRLFKG